MIIGLETAINTGWILLGAGRLLHAGGFADGETGSPAPRRGQHHPLKNLMDFSLGTPIFWLIGFGLMFGGTGKLVGGLDLLRMRVATGRR